jgi:pimeloyl-ACP methyl ester carboxylesterase
MQLPWYLRLYLALTNALYPRLGGIVVANIFTTPRRHNRPPWEQALIDKGRVRTVAGRLFATEWGPSDGKPVILLHGWEGRGAQLGYFIEPLVAKGYRVIAVDGPAHGLSPGERTGPFAFANALVEIDREVGPLRAVVGHSMGGAAGTIALSNGLRTEALVLLGAPSDLSEVLDRFCAWLGIPPRVHSAFRDEMALRTGLPVSATRLLGIAHQFPKLPVLVIHDPADAEVPVSNGRRAAEAFPAAVYHEMECGGHRRMLKNLDVVRLVASFL